MVRNKHDSRVLYAEIKQDEHYEVLADITDRIIKRFLLEEVLYENELGHIQYDDSKDRYGG